MLKGLAEHWAASLVAALHAKGIVSGDAAGRFDPDALLTRGQLAKLFVVGLGFDQEAQLLSRYGSRYKDIPASHWAKGYIESLAEIGLTEGYGDGSFGPNDPVTRAQLAVLLVRASGLSDQARTYRYERTSYRDDREIPAWARGQVFVATEKGLMTGFGDGSFRPLEPVTRAEGSAVLLRMLNLRGTAYHMTGTLIKFDVPSRTGIVRDEMGQQRSFTMAEEAEYFRRGVPAPPLTIRPPDQVWIVLGDDGRGRFMEARYTDLLAERIEIANNEAVLTVQDGQLKVFPVQPNALVFLNGRPVSLSEVSGTGPAYVVFDVTSGAVRIIDAVNTSSAGTFVGTKEDGRVVVVLIEQAYVEYAVADDARFFLNGQGVPVADLEPGDQVRLAVSATGQITYLEAER